MDKRFWAILGVILAIFVGILVFSGKDKANDVGTSNVSATNHVKGQNKANITLVEYGDYECPYCGLFYPTVKQVAAKYDEQIKFQYRNYPLQQVHKNAFAAARAAEAADQQGKFWEMHDALFANQSNWSNTDKASEVFAGYARSLGLDVDQFKKDYASSKVNAIINADIAAFDKLGLKKSTPTFLLDGKQIQPENSVESFSKFIDEAIKNKQQ